jgi:hypothetical protein
MGQVYRALDTRLDRTVALKILPAEYRADPALKQRFDREARTIAALNHPHICVLHDIGEQNGIAFIVMEYLEGETLASRVSRGPLPTEEVFGYSIQIADALDRAHRHGVIHRDLKPANVMLTRSGTKLLDFGLARAPADHLFSNETHPPGSTPITAQGALVGTLQYMSPEQLEGRPIDARTDSFALGAVIYEMATGERAFPGDSQASIIASILNRTPPPPSSRQLVSPPALDHIVARALAKDPEERWQTARDVLLELRTRLGERPPVARSSSVPPIGWLLAGLVLLGIAGSGLLTNYLRPSCLGAGRRPRHDRPARAHALSAHRRLRRPACRRARWAIRRVRCRGSAGEAADLDPAPRYADPEVLPGTDDGTFPFWSPDSRSIAFFANGQLKRLNLDAGSALTLCEAPGGRGGSWSPQGVILFSPGRAQAVFSRCLRKAVPRRP